ADSESQLLSLVDTPPRALKDRDLTALSPSAWGRLGPERWIGLAMGAADSAQPRGTGGHISSWTAAGHGLVREIASRYGQRRMPPLTVGVSVMRLPLMASTTSQTWATPSCQHRQHPPKLKKADRSPCSIRSFPLLPEPIDEPPQDETKSNS